MSKLKNKTVVVTRALGQADFLVHALRERGAYVLHIPTVEMRAPDSWEACDAAIARVEDYNWILFTSSNGVAFFWERLALADGAFEVLLRAKIAAVGDATARCLVEKGLSVDLVPDEFTAENLAQALLTMEDLTAQKILILRPQNGRDKLQQELQLRVASVDAVPVYKNCPVQVTQAEDYARLFNGHGIDLLTFTSPSTFLNFTEEIGAPVVRQWLDAGCHIAAIGPVTAAAIHKQGFPVDILPDESTVRGLLDGIDKYYNE